MLELKILKAVWGPETLTLCSASCCLTKEWNCKWFPPPALYVGNDGWDWRDSSASKMLVMQARGPEFGPQNPSKDARHGGVCWEEETGGCLALTGQPL